jgi:hypothetical protein
MYTAQAYRVYQKSPQSSRISFEVYLTLIKAFVQRIVDGSLIDDGVPGPAHTLDAEDAILQIHHSAIPIAISAASSNTVSKTQNSVNPTFPDIILAPSSVDHTAATSNIAAAAYEIPTNINIRTNFAETAGKSTVSAADSEISTDSCPTLAETSGKSTVVTAMAETAGTSNLVPATFIVKAHNYENSNATLVAPATEGRSTAAEDYGISNKALADTDGNSNVVSLYGGDIYSDSRDPLADTAGTSIAGNDGNSNVVTFGVGLNNEPQQISDFVLTAKKFARTLSKLAGKARDVMTFYQGILQMLPCVCAVASQSPCQSRPQRIGQRSYEYVST